MLVWILYVRSDQFPLNLDCLQVILDLAPLDTLSRMIRLNKTLFQIVARVMYRNPFRLLRDSNHDKMSQSMDRLEYLISICSGYALEHVPKYKKHYIPFPTTINYYTLIQPSGAMPDRPFRLRCLRSLSAAGGTAKRRSTGPSQQTMIYRDYLLCHAEKLSTVMIPLREASLLWAIVARLESMTNLQIVKSGGGSEADKVVVQAVIKLHRQLFPGKLLTIEMFYEWREEGLLEGV